MGTSSMKGREHSSFPKLKQAPHEVILIHDRFCLRRKQVDELLAYTAVAGDAVSRLLEKNEHTNEVLID